MTFISYEYHLKCPALAMEATLNYETPTFVAQESAKYPHFSRLLVSCNRNFFRPSLQRRNSRLAVVSCP